MKVSHLHCLSHPLSQALACFVLMPTAVVVPSSPVHGCLRHSRQGAANKSVSRGNAKKKPTASTCLYSSMVQSTVQPDEQHHFLSTANPRTRRVVAYALTMCERMNRVAR